MSEKLPNNNLKKTDANYLKLLQEASRASRLASLGDKKDLGTIATSGLRCLESSKNLNPVGLLQKMSEALLTSKTAWSSKMCVLIWKVKATKFKRLLFQLQASVPRIAETESGLWATPNTMDHLPQRSPEALRRQATTTRKGRTRPGNLREQVDPTTVKLWRTPDALSGGSNLPGIKKALDQGHLKRPSGHSIEIRLQDQVREKRLWPTPRASKAMAEDVRTIRLRNKDRSKLEERVALWPTPNASDHRDRGNLSDPAIQRRIKLGKQVGLTMAVKEHKGGGTLNPTWVEWLMGYKAGYTDLKDWEILSSRKLRKKLVKQ